MGGQVRYQDDLVAIPRPTEAHVMCRLNPQVASSGHSGSRCWLEIDTKQEEPFHHEAWVGTRGLNHIVRSAFYVRADCAAIHLAVTCWITEMKRAVVTPNIIRPLAA